MKTIGRASDYPEPIRLNDIAPVMRKIKAIERIKGNAIKVGEKLAGAARRRGEGGEAGWGGAHRRDI